MDIRCKNYTIKYVQEGLHKEVSSKYLGLLQYTNVCNLCHGIHYTSLYVHLL